MSKAFDIVALGECLIDFTPAGLQDGRPLFCQNPGGAPANLLAMAAKLGSRTAFIGKVGNDGFGDFLADVMQKAGIDTRALLRDKEIPTTLAFVQLAKNGERSFSFYRKPGADVMLTEQEIQPELLCECKIFHFSGVSLTDEACRTAALTAAKTARKAGAQISFDPNYRPLLWQSETLAKQTLRAALPYADVIKVSEEEMTLLTGETDLEMGAKAILQQGCRCVTVTRGEKGVYYRDAARVFSQPAFLVNAVDTTGAGDAFAGVFLSEICKQPKAVWELNEKSLQQILQKSSAAGALATTKPGAIPALPDSFAISALLTKR